VFTTKKKILRKILWCIHIDLSLVVVVVVVCGDGGAKLVVLFYPLSLIFRYEIRYVS